MSHKNIEVYPKKTNMVKSLPISLSLFDIKRFLGLAGYCRRFAEGFSSIASPLITVTQNKVKFV